MNEREVKVPNTRSSDTTKGVSSSRQQDVAMESEPAKECVTTHLPNELALKMDGAQRVTHTSPSG